MRRRGGDSGEGDAEAPGVVVEEASEGGLEVDAPLHALHVQHVQSAIE